MTRDRRTWRGTPHPCRYCEHQRCARRDRRREDVLVQCMCACARTQPSPSRTGLQRRDRVCRPRRPARGLVDRQVQPLGQCRGGLVELDDLIRAMERRTVDTPGDAGLTSGSCGFSASTWATSRSASSCVSAHVDLGPAEFGHDIGPRSPPMMPTLKVACGSVRVICSISSTWRAISRMALRPSCRLPPAWAEIPVASSRKFPQHLRAVTVPGASNGGSGTIIMAAAPPSSASCRARRRNPFPRRH